MPSHVEEKIREIVATIHQPLSELDTDVSQHGSLRHSTAWGGGGYTWTVESWEKLQKRIQLVQGIVDEIRALDPLGAELSEVPVLKDLLRLRAAAGEYIAQIGEFGCPTDFGILEGPRMTDDLAPLRGVLPGTISRLLHFTS